MSTGLPQSSELDQRDRLLQALSASIRERGLRGTQISDIVRQARTSRRTFYECFPDKESCFVALIDESTSRMLTGIESAVNPEASWDDQVEQAIDTYLAALEQDPAMIATISRELPALGLRGAAVQRQGIERYADLMVRLMRSSRMRASGVREPSLQTAVMLVGGLNELVIHAIEHGEPLRGVAVAAKDAFKAVLAPAQSAQAAPASAPRLESPAS